MRSAVERGDGGDLTLSRSDPGEPIIGQDPTATHVLEKNHTQSGDASVGGAWPDPSLLEITTQARREFAAWHADDEGVVDRHAGIEENGAPHGR